MFICFVALILASYIRHIRGTKPELTKAFPSIAAILEGMQTIRCIEHVLTVTASAAFSVRGSAAF